MFRPPVVTLTRGAIHGSLDKAEVGWLVLTWPTTFPDMGSITLHLVVKSMANGDLVAAVIIYGICQKLEADAMTSPITPPRMLP